jgi:signal transduction histidine kinase
MKHNRAHRSSQQSSSKISRRKRPDQALRVSEEQRTTQLLKAIEALRVSLDRLAGSPELDDFLGQVMAAISRQLGAVFSTLHALNREQNSLSLELVFREDRVLSPGEPEFPEPWRSTSAAEQNLALAAGGPLTVTRLLDANSPVPSDLREYLLGLGLRIGLIIPLSSDGNIYGLLAFYFNREREFRPEELELSRALCAQAGLAIHITRLAKAARQTDALEQLNRAAGEIHDSLAQRFAGISMHLVAAQEIAGPKDKDCLACLQRADDLARFGLAEARRAAINLRPDFAQITTSPTRTVPN